MIVEKIPVESLIPYARNARTHSDDQVAQIAASIREFGFCNPVLIDGVKGIIAGHGRVLAARKLGMQTVPCIELSHLNENQKRAYILADNRLALSAGWDDAMLALEMRDLMDEGYDVGLTGFDLGEIDKILAQVEETEMPTLPTGEKSPFQQMTFTLHDSQAEHVVRAMKAAAKMGAYVNSPNENGNGNALARICETFLSDHGDR